MAQFSGTVVSIALETDVKKNGGGSYKGWELVYRATDNEIRTVAKPVTSLTYNAPLKKQLGELKQGDEFTLTQEKNAAGFFDIKSIVKGIVEASTSASVTSNGTGKASTPTTSNYETRDERNARQRLIVRQSSLAQAVDVLIATKVYDPAVIKGLAEDFTDWVFEKGMVGLQNMESDMPE